MVKIEHLTRALLHFSPSKNYFLQTGSCAVHLEIILISCKYVLRMFLSLKVASIAYKYSKD